MSLDAGGYRPTQETILLAQSRHIRARAEEGEETIRRAAAHFRIYEDAI